jgi:hypothetical protein
LYTPKFRVSQTPKKSQVACNNRLDEDFYTPDDRGTKSLLMRKVYNLYIDKTIMATMLTIMSDIDSHTIR